LGEFDIVLALGLVHHLDDKEARDLSRMGHKALRAGGRMITMHGCYPTQSAAARYSLSRDRGRFVRNEMQYLELAHDRFSDVRATLREDSMRIPYTLLFMECTR
jgi:cyclopropane fatty-acyl-phospholipid synthase-like methyltransferase